MSETEAMPLACPHCGKPWERVTEGYVCRNIDEHPDGDWMVLWVGPPAADYSLPTLRFTHDWNHHTWSGAAQVPGAQSR